MPAKICIPLVLALPVLALARGNPFLRPSARDVSAPPAPVAVPLVAGGGSVRLVDDRALVEDGALASNGAIANDALADHRGDLGAAKFEPFEECPDPLLRAQVIAVHHDAAGRTVWQLQDGRAVRRNPAHDPRHPKLQPLLLVDAPRAVEKPAATLRRP